MREGMSFSLSFHHSLLGPTGAYWLDDLPDVSCKESTRQHAVDDPLLSCKQQVGGSSPPASSHKRRSQPFQELAAQLGVRARLHDLRHFMVTQLVAGGVDWRTVSGRAGHADGHITQAT
jgi:integrase